MSKKSLLLIAAIEIILAVIYYRWFAPNDAQNILKEPVYSSSSACGAVNVSPVNTDELLISGDAGGGGGNSIQYIYTEGVTCLEK